MEDMELVFQTEDFFHAPCENLKSAELIRQE